MKHINLTQMLQGCSKRNGMTVSASNPDGEPTVNRQSRLMSLSGKKAEKEQLSPSCLLSASFPLSFRSRYLRYAAVIFCVLAMSVANIGTAWGATATYVPLGLKTISTDEVVYCTAITAAGDPTTSWVVVPNYGTSSKGYTQITSTTDNGNPQGITDNLASTKSNVAMIQIKKDGNTYSSSKRVIHMHVKGITGVIAHGNTGSANYGLSIAVAEFNNNLSTFPSDITSGVRKSNSGCVLIKKDGLDASKEYIVSIYSSGGDICFYAVEFIAGGGGSTTYSVTYDGNGKTSGSVPTDSKSPYEEGDEVTVLGNTGSLAKTGYTFTGWNTAADGSGTDYAAGATFDMGTANVTLYAQWELNLSTHEPGKYETAAGSGGYGKTLKTVDGRDFEVYMFNSTTLRAGSATTISDGLSMLTASNGNDVIDGKEGWICVKSTGDAAGSGATQKAEFSVTSGTSNDQKTHYIPISNAGYIKLKVSGYDQFSMVGRDGSTTAGSGKFVVKIDGVSQSLTSTTTDHSVYRFSMTTGAHTIEVTSDGSTACRFRGFSLRLPTPSCTAPTSPSITPSNGWLYVPGEEITLTASASNTDASTTYTWYRGATLEAAKAAGAIQAAKTSAQGGTTYTIASCTASDAYKYWCEISNGTGCEASASYDIKLYTFFLYNNNHSNNSSHAFTYIDRTSKKLSVTFDVENSDYTYYFKVSDGLGTWFGKDDYTITSSTNYCNGLSSSGANVGWTTTYPGSYTIDYYYASNNIVIIYPTHNQTAGQTIYFDNHLTDMSNMYIRIGNKSYASASSAINTLVAGTKSLYQASTIAWDGFYAWSIADNQGWQSNNTIYQPWNEGETIKPNGEYTITKQTNFQNYVVDETITLIPTVVNNTEYGCTYYSVDKYSGQKTYTVTTSDNTNCTVTLQKCTNYGSSTYTSLSSGETVLPTQYIKVTITPTAGYEYSSISITNATEVTAPTAGSPVGVYYVTGNSAISVTCSAASYTVTLNTNDGTINAGNVTSYTYGTGATLPTNVTKDGHRFMGWYDNEGLTGSAVTTIANDATGNKTYWAKWAQVYTITNGAPANGTITISKSSAIEGEAVTISVEANTGYTFNAWNIYKTSDAGTTVSPAAASASTSFTMPAYNVTVDATFNAKTTTITINANTSYHGSTAPSPITATYGSALPSFTAAAGESGWNLTGYFTEATSGTKVINADGTLVASTDYADASGNWKYESATLTLYAQYEEAPAPAGDCEDLFVCTATTATSCTATTGSATYNIASSGGGSCSIGGYSYYIKPNSSNVIVASPKEGKSFAAGDSLIFVVYNPNETAKTMGFVLASSSTEYTHEVAAGKLHYFRQKLAAADISGGKVTFNRKSGDDRWIGVTIKHCETVSCSTPSAPTATSNGATAATTQVVNWTDGSNDKWDVYVSPSSSTPAAGVTPTASGLTAKTYTFTGLMASTTYYWWVRSVCDDTHKSSWYAGSSFATSAAAGTTYYLVTSTAQLNATDTYIIANSAGTAVMSTTTADTNKNPDDITSGFSVDGSTLTVTSASPNLFKLTSATNGWLFKGGNGSGNYISSKGTPDADLWYNTSSTPANNTGEWAVSFASGIATMKLGKADETTYHIYYDATNTKFIQSATASNIKIYTSAAPVSCTVAPTVSATIKGATTSTTQVVNCSGISSLGTGTCTITSYGFVYGTSANPTLSDSHVEVGTSYTVTGTAFAETTLTGLTPSTTYYVRAYATNGAGTGYGDAVSFTTSAAPAGAPVITDQPDLSEVALGETASFSLTATGATSYQWYSCDSEGENRVEASGASATTDNYSYTTTATGTTYYICKVSNASGDTWSEVVGSIVTPATFTVKYTAGADDGKTYDIAGGANDFTQGHEAVSEVADKFSNWSNYTFTGVGISSTGKKGTMSMLISMPTAYDADKYVSFHFDLAANYQLQLTNVNLQVQAKDNVGQSFKFVISDAYGHSYTKEVASLGQTGKLVQIGGDISETTKFVGTITLKLYGWYSSTDYYRLAKEVTITGEVSSLPAPTASWTARPASATVGDGGKTYTLTTDGTNRVAWSITDQSGATGAALSPTSGLTTTLSNYSAAGSLYVQASVTGDGIHYLSTPATLLRQRVVISGDCSETTLISATLSSGSGTGAVTGTPGGTSAVSFTSVKEVDGGYKMGGDGSYVYLTLSGDENFAANDEVKITITKASDQGDGALHIYKYASETWTELGSVTAAGAGTYSYTLTETNVSTAFNTIGLYRTGSNQNPYVKALSVVRNSCSASKPSSVSVTASPAGPYAIDDALTLTVEATNADTYQWYSNTNNTASDGFLLVGETATTYSPSTAIAGTTYYYCVATNTSGSTVSNIITVTVNSAKTAPTVSWTDTDESPNYGGGGYAVKATVSTAEWDGTLTTDMLTASDGVTLTGVSVSGKVITATYGVTETARSPLSFSLTLPETTNYTALAANKEISFTRCGEGAVIATTETQLPVKSSYTTASNPTYRWETAGVGWLTLVTGSSTLSSTSDSYSGFSYRSNSGKSSITFYSELDAVTAVRIYIKGGGSTTLSKVQKGTTLGKYTKLTPSTDYDYLYSNGSSSIESREQGYIEITFKTALSANTFVEITLSRNTEYYGVGLITGNSEVGNITTALSWATDPGETVNKTTTDANFRYEAEKASDAASQATLGTISYKSSVPAVATVSATGVVDILSAGSTTITATLASSGCYKKATLSYNLVVAEATCTDVAGTITASGEGITIDGNTVTKANACAAVTLTVSGHTGEDDGATYQWYKDGVSMGESYRSKSISVTANGDYTVEVTNDGGEHCTMPATNTITITGNAISITKIVDEWYVKNDRRTPDIALATIEGTTSYTVNDGSSNITTFAGCGFELRDGILYLKGTQDDGSAPSGLAAGDVTLTITAVSACGDDPTTTITIHKQVKTAKPSIAFIVDGTSGDPVNSVATTKTSSRPIWVYLSTYFDLTGCNAYWTNNEKQIRQYYSQFDAIVITDDPSTDAKPKSGLKYVNALGTMVDVRPILTMEAYVGKYGASSNWHIGGTPSSPNPRQYELKLQCKDHDIFSDLTPSANFRSEEIDGETYYYVTMVDNSVTPYAGLADDAETETYPALQGFSASAIKGTGLLGIGTISDGTLQGGVERQDEQTARMMILGIQHQAMAALTSEGKQVIKNAINYLLKTDMEEVDDCSNYFIGTTGSEWSNASNWSSGKVPDASTKARILVPVTISTKVHVAQVDIAVGGRSKHYDSGNTDCSGSVTIASTGALIVDGQVRRTTNGRLYTEDELQPTTPSDLILETSNTSQSALIFDNSDGETQATVEMYSPSYWEVMEGTNKKKSYWSYVGVPIQDVPVGEYFYGAVTYLYDETSGWIRKRIGSEFHAFEGIGLSLPEGNRETFYGTLASTETKEITLTKTTDVGEGDNLIGNSWTAPIQIGNFDSDDFGSATAVVSMYKTGRDDIEGSPTVVTASAANDGAVEAGQWVSIPIGLPGTDGYDGPTVIPSMQAFQVTTSSETTLTLNYDKLIRDVTIATDNLTQPMSAPKRKMKRAAKKSLDAMMRVRMSGFKTRADLWIMEDGRFSDEYDNGWEANYIECDNRSPQLYANSEIGKMAFLAKPDIEGTILGIAPSRDGNEYLFTFHYVGDEEFYLNDLKLKQSVLISEEESYSFMYEDGDTNRFYISRTRIDAPQMPTGVENTHGDAVKARKFIYNDKLYIMLNGRVYSAEGQIVK